MKRLEINNLGQANYSLREVVKMVVVDEDNNIHYLQNGLLGGGVEPGETHLEAMHREALEEAGYTVEVVGELGEVLAFRDTLQKKYVTQGFLVKLASKNTPTTSQEDELHIQISLSPLPEAITYFENKILLVENYKEKYIGDEYQSKLFNAMTALHFLNEIKKSV